MVWIYGGGNAAGTANVGAYSMPYFAGDPVSVTMFGRVWGS